MNFFKALKLAQKEPETNNYMTFYWGDEEGAGSLQVKDFGEIPRVGDQVALTQLSRLGVDEPDRHQPRGWGGVRYRPVTAVKRDIYVSGADSSSMHVDTHAIVICLGAGVPYA